MLRGYAVVARSPDRATAVPPVVARSPDRATAADRRSPLHPRPPTKGLLFCNPKQRFSPLSRLQLGSTIATMERYRIHPEAAVYFVTYSIVEWLPVFIREATCKIVTDSLTFCHGQKHLRINAFVIMPTHLHLIVFDSDFDSERLVPTLADFRKFTG